MISQAVIYGVKYDHQTSKNSTLALSIVVMSLMGLEIILNIVECTLKEWYEKTALAKMIFKLVPSMAHIAVWISVQVYVFSYDFDAKDSIL